MSILIPDFINPFPEDENSVRQRFYGWADAELSVREGSWAQTLTEPLIKEDAVIYSQLGEAIKMSSPLYAVGVYLDYKAAEHGLERRSATYAQASLIFTGTDGVFIPQGTRVVAPAQGEGQETIRFLTDEGVTIAAGSAVVSATADTAGIAARVEGNSLTLLEDAISGVSGVSNALPAEGGTDDETDEELRARLLEEIAAPKAAGAKSDYQRWILTRDGVGSATIIPQWDGPFTVKAVLLDADNNAVSQGVIDDVTRYLLGDAEVLAPSTPATAAVGSAGALTGTFYYKVTYVTLSGTETDDGVVSGAVSPAGQRVSLSNIPIATTVEVGTVVGRNIYRSTANDGSQPWYKVSAGATPTIANNVDTTYTDNTDVITGNRRIPRANNTTQWDGLAPIGHIVTVDTPTAKLINVSATVTLAAGYSTDGTGGTVDVTPLVSAAIGEYIQSLTPSSEVVFQRVVAAFFSVDGVQDVTSPLINSGTSNVVITDEEVAALGTVTLGMSV